jgi:hypothetical protein
MGSRSEHARGKLVRCEHLQLEEFSEEMRIMLDELCFTEVWSNVRMEGVRTRHETSSVL